MTATASSGFAAELYRATSPRTVFEDLLGRTFPPRDRFVEHCPNPSHEDAEASCSFDLARGLFNCFACGIQGDVVDLAALLGHGHDAAAAIGYLRDRYMGGARIEPSTNGHAAPSHVNGGAAKAFPFYVEAVSDLGWTLGEYPGANPHHKGKTVILAPEHDEHFGVVRTKIRGPREGKRLLCEHFPAPRKDEHGNPIETLPTGFVGDVLRLETVAEATWTFVVAGETDALAVRAAATREGLGVLVVAPASGETTSFGTRAQLLRGVRTAFAWNTDKTGIETAPLRMAELRAAGARAVEVRVPRGKDVRGFLESGGTLLELVRIAEAAESGADVELGAEPIDWADPVPFGVHDLPAFPVAALPSPIAAWASATAEALQVPVDLPSMVALGVLAAATAGKYEVRVRAGWQEPLGLYILVAADSGTRKSAVFASATRVLYAYQDERARMESGDRRRATDLHDAAESRVAAASRRMGEARDPESLDAARGEYEEALAQLDRTPPSRAPYRLLGDDVTPERLASLLAEQGGRFALLSPEGGMLRTVIGARYSKSGTVSYDTLLKAHAGDAIQIDRKGSEPVFVARPTLTLVLAVQPTILAELASEPTARGVGLLARFCYATPTNTVGSRTIRPPAVPADVEAMFQSAIRTLLELPEADVAKVLELTADADDALAEFEGMVEPRLAPGADLQGVADWGSKVAGAVARIAASFALAESSAFATRGPTSVEVEHVQRAIEIGCYLIPHAVAAFDVAVETECTRAAKRLLSWIERRGVQSFTARDAYKALRGTGGLVQRMADVEPALAVLVERGYLVAHKSPHLPRKPGRPPSDAYLVHPSLVRDSVVGETGVK